MALLLVLLVAITFVFAQDTYPEIEIQFQPRLEAGDIYKEGGEFKSRSDLYIRRFRVKLKKKWKDVPGKWIKVKVTLSADKIERDFKYKSGKRDDRKTNVRVKYAYITWAFSDAFKFRIGKTKMPISRVSLTSSSRQLFIDRPFTTEDAKDWLGRYDSLQVVLYGALWEGLLRYALSISDGSSIEDENKAGNEVLAEVSFGNFRALRLEFSPPNMIEKKKDDTGVRKGKVLSIALYGGEVEGFDVDGIPNERGRVLGADFFYRGSVKDLRFVLQGEVLKMDYKKTGRKEEGWFLQGGVNFPFPVGRVEPALRYERQNVRYKNLKRKIFTLGLNHYIKAHSLKWSYNLILIDNSDGADQKVHQIQAQVYF